MRVARNFVVERRLPNGRKIFISPDAQLKYLKSSFDEELVRLAGGLPADSVVWDVGANCGVFAFSCPSGSQIVCFEADPFLAGLLRRSARENRDLTVEVREEAVSDSNGKATFVIAAHGRATNHLSNVPGSTMSGGERQRITVQVLTLDSFLAATRAPTFIKIDVEGAEREVLRGARRVLESCKPIIYLEANSETLPDCRTMLIELGYSMNKATEMNWVCYPDNGAPLQQAAPEARQ